MNKRELLIKYIETLDDQAIEEIYSELLPTATTEHRDLRTEKIIEGLKPLITFLYFHLDHTQLDILFKRSNR